MLSQGWYDKIASSYAEAESIVLEEADKLSFFGKKKNDWSDSGYRLVSGAVGSGLGGLTGAGLGYALYGGKGAAVGGLLGAGTGGALGYNFGPEFESWTSDYLYGVPKTKNKKR